MSLEERSKKYLFVGILWVLIIGISVLAWHYLLRPRQENRLKEATGSTSQYKHHVCFITDSFSGYSILRSDEFTEELRMGGIKITHIVDNADYTERMKRLRDGECPFTVFTIDSEIKAGANPAINDFPGTTVFVIDDSFGGDGALVNKHAVKRMEDIERIVYPMDSPGEFLARVLAATFSLPKLLQEKWVGEQGAEEVYKKAKFAGREDKSAYVLWEPYITKALADNPDLTVMLDSSKMKGFITDVWKAERKYVDENPEVVVDVIKSYLRVAYQFSQDPKKLVALVIEDAKQFGGVSLSETEAQQVVAKIRFKTTVENYAHFGIIPRTEAQGLESLEDIYEKVARVLEDTNAISTNPISGKAHAMYYDGPLRHLYQSKFHPARKINIVNDPTLPQATDEVIRGDQQLKELTGTEWSQLHVVGDMKVQPLSFQRGRFSLSLESKRSLDELAQHIASWPEYYLTVVGHARDLGDIEASMRLAEKRAATAKDYLVEKGISKPRLRVQVEKPSGTDVEDQSTTFVVGQLSY